jgi:MFS family permease
LLASLIVSLLAASSAPTPLYALYAQSWHFTPITTTIVFGVYALAVLASLLTFGRLSDYAGRRPVLLAALTVQVISLLMFASADGVGELLAARVVQGLSTGAAIGAIGAGMLDIGFGSGFQGGIRTVVPLAAPHERAGVLSLLFVISYLGMGVPAVAAGFGATHGLGLLGSARDYGAAVLVLAALALAGLRRTR